VRHLLVPGAAFALLTALGELLVASVDLLPLNPAMAREAVVSDDALRLLFALAVPVGAFTLAALLYGIWAFRRRGDPAEDGPPLRGHRAVTVAWLVVTTALCLVVIVNPGITGLAAMAQSGDADLVVGIAAQRWSFSSSYPQHGVTKAKELVLPVNRRVRLELTAVDVVHGVWIPAFRVKKDAVPGITTAMYVTPTRLGSSDGAVNLQMQCSQLCGLAHSTMTMPVRVVTDAEFQAWVARNKG
jgi:cytochrome c oxidase subunit 2